MKKFQVGFSVPKNHPFPLFSWLIRWAEAKAFWGYNNVSHAYVRWYSDSLKEWNTYEASGFTLHFLGNTAYKKHLIPVELFEVEIEDEDFKEALKYCVQKAGSSYSLIGALRLGWPYIREKFTGKYKDHSYNDGESSQYCSEVTGRFLKKVGIDINVNFESLGVHRLRLIMRELAKQDKVTITRIM